MKRVLLPAVVLAMAAIGLAAQAQTITCPAVARQVALKGPSRTVEELAGSSSAQSKAWQRVVDLIATGRPDCVQLAKALYPRTDAAFAEGVDYALSRALQHNPAAVLANLGGPLKIDSICFDNQIEATPQQHRSFQRKANAALRRVTAPSLRASRDACLADLNR